jgi:hypothetical protein
MAPKNEIALPQQDWQTNPVTCLKQALQEPNEE